MSHLHLPDGVLPVWLWIAGLLAAAAINGAAMWVPAGRRSAEDRAPDRRLRGADARGHEPGDRPDRVPRQPCGPGRNRPPAGARRGRRDSRQPDARHDGSRRRHRHGRQCGPAVDRSGRGRTAFPLLAPLRFAGESRGCLDPGIAHPLDGGGSRVIAAGDRRGARGGSGADCWAGALEKPVFAFGTLPPSFFPWPLSDGSSRWSSPLPSSASSSRCVRT